jgi:uncharacterized protein (TIRG00374 family)
MSSPEAVGGSPQHKRPLRFWINVGVGLAMSGLFVWLAARGADWGLLKEEAARMEALPLVGYVLIIGLSHTLRLWRWGLTVRPLAPVPWRRILGVGAVGMLAIFALPARLGEFARPLMIREGYNIGLGQAMATVVVERIIDGLVMSAMLFGTVLWLEEGQVPDAFLWSGYAASTLFGGLSVGLLVSGLLFRRIAGPLEALLGKASPALAERVVGMIGGFFGALRLLSSWRVALAYLGVTVVIWALSAGGLWVLFQATPGATGHLPPVAASATLSMIVVGITLPSGPGTVGVFHWAVVFALGMFKVPQEPALLLATVLHLMIAAVNLAWGVLAWALGWAKFSLGGSPPQAS